MARTKVRGITIQLGADTSGLSKALNGVNTEIKSTQKQLKDVEKLLKLDPKNTELLEQKQKLLSNAVEQTSTKLESLKKAQEEVGKTLAETGEGQEQYDALSREIIVCEEELKKAKKDADGFNVTLTKVSETAKSLSGSFSKAAEKTKGLSAAAGGVLAGMGSMALKSAAAADDLNTLAKQTGLTTESLQKMQYASDLIDVPVDSITGSLKKLKKNMDSTSADTQAAWEQIGVSVTDSTGQFRDIEDVFYDVLQGLSEIPNETERDIVAMQLFGKSADELAGLIDDGGASLKALGEEAQNLGVIIPQESLDKANELNDTVDRLKAQATGTFAALGTEIAEMLIPYLPKIQEAIEKVFEAITKIDPDKLGTIAKIAAVVAAISPLLAAISGVMSLINGIIAIAPAVGTAITIMTGPIGLIIAAIAAAIAIGVLLYKNWDTIKEKAKEVGDKLKEIWEKVKDAVVGAFQNMWNGIKGFINKIISGVESMVNNVIRGINRLLSGISKVANAVGEVLGLNPINLQLSEISLPRLAKGGIVSNGSAIVGEAGAELLSVRNGQAMVQPLGGTQGTTELTSLLKTYLPYLAQSQNIVMDSGALVGSIAPDMSRTLGRMAHRGQYV